MDPFHERLARTGLAAAERYGFALAGGYAVQAAGLLERPSEDVDLFTAWDRRNEFTAAVAAVVNAYRNDGLTVETERQYDTFARLAVTDGVRVSKVELGVDWRANEPILMAIGPVLHPDDAVANRRVRKPMLYPLSYEGARAQSSDLGVHLGWQGVARDDPRSPDPCSPSPGPNPESPCDSGVILEGRVNRPARRGCVGRERSGSGCRADRWCRSGEGSADPDERPEDVEASPGENGLPVVLSFGACLPGDHSRVAGTGAKPA
ncbi:nucleotidyl transferase AbiEii/AbiGii toxin family protein [Verrucosispora sp. WMMA2121]|nr:nucleotidyl transferase AbiEii/AbiGii toxin family protein [Verrucosispora sp. WMMA2121]MCZ7421213.1 nucleotidyl transferase AbiEii/AbiGii toxin family protein [Verrucosispora sp. WMMA2121]